MCGGNLENVFLVEMQLALLGWMGVQLCQPSACGWRGCGVVWMGGGREGRLDCARVSYGCRGRQRLCMCALCCRVLICMLLWAVVTSCTQG
jgi:hypothetical protein